MKCSVSPTTCIAGSAQEPDAAGVVRGAVGAVLFAEILKPLTTALGPVGDVVAGTMTQSVFVRNVL